MNTICRIWRVRLQDMKVPLETAISRPEEMDRDLGGPSQSMILIVGQALGSTSLKEIFRDGSRSNMPIKFFSTSQQRKVQIYTMKLKGPGAGGCSCAHLGFQWWETPSCQCTYPLLRPAKTGLEPWGTLGPSQGTAIKMYQMCEINADLVVFFFFV